jgi:hypothetical protein
METRTAASIAEMLHAVGRTLEAFKGYELLSKEEAAHLVEAQKHIDASVRRWVNRMTAHASQDAIADDANVLERELPASPKRGLDAVTDMLHIYGERVDARDFTPAQQRRLLVVAFNLSIVAQEMMTSVH